MSKSLVEFLSSIREANIKVTLNGDKLKINAPTGALTDEIKAELKARKDDIIAFLQGASSAAPSAIPVATRPAHIPLSFSQQRLWFLDQISPGGTSFNMPFAMKIHGELDVEILSRVFATIIERHESLRTTFDNVEGQGVQIIHPPAPWSIPLEDISYQSDEHRQQRLQQVLVEETQTPFDLVKGPLLRVRLLRLQKETSQAAEHALFITLHHIVTDGWSTHVFISEIGALYNAYVSGLPSPLPPLVIQYADFALWQRDQLESGELKQQLSYWRKKAKNIPQFLNLPTDFPRSDAVTSKGKEITFLLSNETTEKLSKAAAEGQYTLYMYLLTAFYILLEKYTGQQDLCIGTPNAGRNRRELENLIGFFLNAIVLRTDLSGNPKVSDILERVKETTLGAFSNQDIPTELWFNEMDFDRAMNQAPGMQAVLILQNLGAAKSADDIQSQSIGGLAIEPMGRRTETAKHEICLTVSEGDDQLKVDVEFDVELFRDDTIHRLMGHFERLLNIVLEESDQYLQALNFYSQDELIELLKLKQEEVEQVLPLTSMQRDMFINGITRPDSLDNNIGLVMLFEQEFDPEIAKQAIELLIAEYGLFRTRLTLSSSPYTEAGYQVVYKQLAFDLEWEERTDRQYSDDEKKALGYEFINLPYQMDGGELFRYKVFHFGGSEYALVLTCHHALLDGVGGVQKWVQFARAYESIIRGSSYQPIPETFADYVNEERAEMDHQEVVEYWKNALVDVAALDFSVPDHASQVELSASKNGSRVFKTDYIEAPLWQGIQAYCKANRTTPPRFLKGVYALLLNLYCQPEGSFYTKEVLASRTSKTKDSFGCFIQQVPMVFDEQWFLPDTDISELFQGINQYQKAIKQYNAISIHEQNQLLPKGRVAFLYNYFHFYPDTHFLDGHVDVTCKINEIEEVVELSPEPQGDRVLLKLVYWSGLFKEHYFLDQLIHVAEQIVAGAKRVGDLNWLVEAEQHQLQEWNSTQKSYPNTLLVPELITLQAQRVADQDAVVCGEHRLTYGELNQKANQLANCLLDQGVSPGQLVGICIDKSVDMVIALWGILKAGAGYVPLDPNYPADRIQYMLEQSKAPAVVTKKTWQGLISESVAQTGAQVISLDRDDFSLDTFSDQEPTTVHGFSYQPDQVAYVIFTSGSTGLPKGVMIEQQPWLEAYLAWRDVYELAQEERRDAHLQMASISFDVCAGDFVRAFCSGDKMVLCPQDTLLSNDDLYALIKREEVTIAEFVPVVLRGFAQYVADKGEKLESMRLLMVGSDAWFGRDHQLVQSICGSQTRLLNTYGVTEAVIDSSWFEATGKHISADHMVSIGRPFPNTTFYVLDKQRKPVPLGVSGELYIGGNSLAKGYINRPDLTQEVYLSDPFLQSAEMTNDTSNGRMYKTGDYSRFLPNGEIELLGRIGNQVKVRGFRIELGEVEAGISQIPQVNETVVLAKEGETGRFLCGYVELKPEQSITIAELKRELASFLPEFMIPTAYVILEKFPTTPNGKIDRRALPEPDLKAQLTAEYVAPRNDLEKELCAIWVDVLAVPKVGIKDNFFELGGHSLLATQVVSRVRSLYRLDLPLRLLFEKPTVEELALKVQELQLDEHRVHLPDLVKVEKADSIPLSFAQQRLWFLDQLEPGNSAYIMPGAVRFKGEFHVEHVRQALKDIVSRHESLRTVFKVSNEGLNDTVLQVIRDESEFNLLEVDVSPLTKEEQSQRVMQVVQETCSKPFDLEKGPLFRVAIIKEHEHSHVLAIAMHHIISDGWSIGVLINEFVTLYDSHQLGKPSPLNPLPVQYGDFSIWQRSWLQGELLQQQVDFWKNSLDRDAFVLDLPTDFVRPKQSQVSGAFEMRTIDKALVERFNNLVVAEGASLFMGLLTLFNVILHRYSSQDQINVGTPVAGRNRAEVEQLIGFFINTLVIGADLSGQPSFREMLNRIKEKSFAAFAHQDLPFEKLVEELNPERDLSRTPLFQVFFNLINLPPRNKSLAGLEIEVVGDADAQQASKFDMTLYAKEQEHGLDLILVYNDQLFTPNTVQQLLAHYEELLQGVLHNADRSIEAYPLHTEGADLPDLTQSLTLGNYPSPVELFQQRVAQSPGKLAITDASANWSYQQVDQVSNALANLIVEAGVNVEHRVAIIGSRCAGLPVAVLACMKAGAAFMLVDGAYPVSRQQEYFDIAHPKGLIVLSDFELDPLLKTDTVDWRFYFDREFEKLPTATDINVNLPEVQQQLCDGLAYVTFTSGTTGNPKAIANKLRPLSHFLNWYQHYFSVSETDHFSMVSGVAHDPILRDMLVPLTLGATLHVPSQDIILQPGALPAWYVEKGITVSHLTPALAELLLMGEAETSLDSLKTLVFGGDRLPRSLAKQITNIAPNVNCFNAYGATETPQIMAIEKVDAQESDNVPVALGRGIDHVELCILNRSGHLASVGEAGEICIRTPYLCAGYFNDPELSATKFIVNESTQRPDDKLYRTGDKGRYLADGRVAFLGRLDHQVQIRGYRVEPGAIETHISQMDFVDGVKVLPFADKMGHQQLAAYFVAKKSDGEALISALDIRDQLAVQLPDYMVPQAIIPIAKIPLTPNGKVDRGQLPNAADWAERSRDRVAPETELQKTLCRIWSEVLKVPEVGIEDNFFELGGHSLLATQVAARVRKECGVDLPLKQMFQCPNVRLMADAIESMVDQALHQESVIEKVDYSQAIPLSFTQQRLWLMAQISPNDTSYNMQNHFIVTGGLDLDAFDSALVEVTRRQASLRTIFKSEDGEPYQLIQSVPESVIQLVDKRDTVETDRDQIIHQQVAKASRHLFKLDQGPLFFVMVTQLPGAGGDLLVSLVLHHIISDGWSQNILTSEVLTLYSVFKQGQPSPLPELPIQYADYAAWQRNVLVDQVLDEKIDWWVNLLHDAPQVLPLPTDRPRPPVQTLNGALYTFKMDAVLAEQIKQFCLDMQITPFMALITLYKVTLALWTRTSDIVVAVPVGNRGRKETEGLIGFFVNGVVTRLKLEGNANIKQAILEMKDHLLTAFANQDIPIELVAERLNIQRNAAYPPVAQVGFQLLDVGHSLDASEMDLSQFGGLNIESLSSDNVSSKVDMTLMIGPRDDSFVGLYEYNCDLFNESTIAEFHTIFTRVIEQVVKEPDIHLHAINTFTQQELMEKLQLDPQQIQQVSPLTTVQRDLYLESLFNPTTIKNSIGYIVEFRVELERERATKILQYLADQQSMLRTRFRSVDIPFMPSEIQVIYKPSTESGVSHLDVDWRDVRGDNVDREQLLKELSESVYSPYDVTSDEELLKIKVYQVADDDTIARAAVHHGILDGVGLMAHGIILGKLYEADLAGMELPPLPDLFLEQIELDRRQMDTSEVIEFWREELKTVNPVSFSMPMQINEQGIFEYKEKTPVHKEYSFDSDHWGQIKSWTRKKRITPAIYLKAVYGLLVHAWTHTEEDFTVFEFAASRPQTHMFTLGCYYTQFPSVFETEVLNRGKTISDLFLSMRQHQKRMKDKQKISILKQRQMIGGAGLQFMYNFNPFFAEVEFMGQTHNNLGFVPNVDDQIQLLVKVINDQLSMDMHYYDDLFDDHFLMDRMEWVSQQLIGGVENLSELSLLLPGEEKDLDRLNETARKQHTPVNNVVAMIQQKVAAHPDVVAVSKGDSQLTYLELDRQSNQLAVWLREKGVSRGDRIAVCLDPGVDFVVAILGIVKIGATYVPVDATYPVQRIAYIVENANAHWLIAEACLADALARTQVDMDKVVYLDRLKSELANYPVNSDTPLENLADELIYVIYTSGSTGNPKGAGVYHRSEINLVNWYRDTFLDESHFKNAQLKNLVISSVGFDLTQKNFWGTLASGGEIIFPSSEQYDDQLIVNTIVSQGVSTINCAPSAFYPLIENCMERGDYSALASLRWVILGGEPIRASLFKGWVSSEHYHAHVVNSYGPTECADIACFYQLNEQVDILNNTGHTNIPIGQPNDNVNLYVMDQAGRRVPSGIAGELYIGGSGVGVGYLGLTELTESVFIEHPQYGRLYKTGDLVRQREDGLLEYIGRVDFQVKVRGLRIELGEVEFALRQLDKVQDALVMVNEDRLTAYLMVGEANGLELDNAKSGWREQLADYLPVYMIPSDFITLDAWPLTPNGKVDRNALAKITPSSQQKSDYVAPRTDIEKQLVAVWEEILQKTPIGIHDDFFDLGGHSLLATKAISRLRKEFDIDINIRAMFDATTIALVAQKIEEALAHGQHKAPPLLPVDPRPDFVPLSYNQQRLWFMEKMAPGSNAFNMPMALKITGTLDVTCLGKVFAEVVRRHESLRTIFAETEEGEASQQLIPAEACDLLIQNIQDQDEGDQQRFIKESIKNNQAQGFDLEKGPLFRVTLIVSGSESSPEYVLLACMHHIISDGWSVQILLKEVVALYTMFAQNLPSPLPELPVQYADFALWQREWLQGEVLESQLNYWQQQLKGAPKLLGLPTDRPRPQRPTNDGAIYEFRFSEQQRNKIVAFCREQGVTPFVAMLAAFQLTLSRYAAQKDVCVGIPSAGRDREEIEGLIGFFINSMVMRTQLGGNPSVSQLLAQVKESVMGGLANQDVPADMVLESLQVDRSANYPPIAQVAFQLNTGIGAVDPESAGQMKAQFGDLSLESIYEGGFKAKYDMTLTLQLTDEELRGSINFATELFDESTIELFCDHLQNLTEQLTENPGTPIDAIDLVKPDELFDVCELDRDLWQSVWPLTAMQRDMVMDSLVNPSTLQSSHGWAIHVHRALDVELWQTCLQEFADEQPVVRSRFVSSQRAYADVMYQAARQAGPIHFEYRDLSEQNLSDADVKSITDQMIYRAYDVTRDDLVHFAVLKIAEEHFVKVAIVHHAIMDGAALNSLWEQVTKRYQEKLDGTELTPFEAHLFEESVQLDRQLMDTLDVRQFWQNKLATTEPLDFSMPSPVPEPAHFITRSRYLQDEHWAKVKKFCRKNRITPALYFKCLYGMLVNTYCRPDADFSVQETMGGRTPSTATAQGCYIQEIPFVFRKDNFNEEADITELFRWAREFQKSIKDQRLISIGAQIEIAPRGRIGFMYNFYQFLANASFLGEALFPEGTPSDPTGNVQFVVTLVGDQLKLDLFYHRHLFNDFGFLDRLVAVSEQIVDEGISRMGDLEWLINPEERHHLLHEWAGYHKSYDLTQPIHVVFEAQVEKTPDLTAVVFNGARLSYREVNGLANQLARQLVRTGVTKNGLVGLYGDRSDTFLIGILATLKAGAAYVPMDPKYPDDRILYMLEDSQVNVVLTQRNLLTRVALPEGVQAICLDELQADPSQADNLNVKVAPFDRAYMVYTSGSTGQPKGAIVRHNGALNHIEAERDLLGFSKGFTFMQTAPSSSDISVWQFLGPVTCGGKVVVLDEVTDTDKLFQLMTEEQVELVELVPIVLQLLIEKLSALSEDERQLPNLKWMMATGEAVPVELVNHWLALYPDIPVINAYGPTEAADDVIQATIDKPLGQAIHSVPIGKPIPNMAVYVLDEQLRLTPPGVPGEICIAGVGVGEGYWNKPEKTAEAFVANPFSFKEGDTLYRTGDLGRWLPDGSIEYINRVDNQVKIRGFRIELGEIEAILDKHPNVKEIAVIVRDDLGEKALVAYFTQEHGSAASEMQLDSELRRWVSEQLPDYMVPSYFVHLDEMPLTPAGKVDRKNLPKPEQQRRDVVAARNPLEQQLVAIWEEILLQSPIGIHDDFFALGGHSILAVRLMAKIKQQLAAELPLATLFQHSTIAELAAAMVQRQRLAEQDLESWSPLVPLRESDSAKQNLFVIHPVGGEVMVYYPLAMALPDQLNVYGLQAQGFLTDQALLPSVQAMAKEYKLAIRLQQSEGPYTLAGQSLGGTIALEVAKLLEEEGQVVSNVILMDTFIPSRMEVSEKDELDWLQQLAGDIPLPLEELRGMSLEAMVDRLIEIGRQLQLLPAELTNEKIQRMVAVAKNNHDAVRGYQVPTVKSPITHIRAEQPSQVGSSEEGWNTYFKEDQIVYELCPGSHEGILREPNVEVLSSLLIKTMSLHEE